MNEKSTYTPAAVYARVSSDRQDVDLSFAAQLRAHAERNRFVIAHEYVAEANGELCVLKWEMGVLRVLSAGLFGTMLQLFAR